MSGVKSKTVQTKRNAPKESNCTEEKKVMRKEKMEEIGKSFEEWWKEFEEDGELPF